MTADSIQERRHKIIKERISRVENKMVNLFEIGNEIKEQYFISNLFLNLILNGSITKFPLELLAMQNHQTLSDKIP